MLGSSLCDYSDAYILVSGTITTTGTGEDGAGKRLDKKINKGVISKIVHHSLTEQVKK